MKIYQAICAVSLALSKDGIGKDRQNVQQGYKFRGIDDVYNALAPLLAANGLCILPRVLSRECVERVSSKGGALFYVTVEVEFDLVSAEDQSKHTVRFYGEAMDSGDKATNKAMSAAYKYMAMEVFSIPTQGDNDADATTHEVAPKIQPNDAGKTLWETAEPDEKALLSKALSVIRDFLNTGNAAAAAEHFYTGSKLDVDEMAAVWSQLSAGERKNIKANKREK
jgi:ERF superfamily